MGLWYEKPEFEKWNKIVQELANRIEKKLGGEYKIEWRPLEGTLGNGVYMHLKISLFLEVGRKPMLYESVRRKNGQSMKVLIGQDTVLL